MTASTGAGVPTVWDAAMSAALNAAHRAASHGDVPVGAVVLDADGSVLAVAGNERELTGDPTAHAEVLALRRAAAVRGEYTRGDPWWHRDDPRGPLGTLEDMGDTQDTTRTPKTQPNP